MTINQRIKQIRNTKGLSQSKMAEMLGVSLKTYQRYEQDGYKIPERVLRQIEVTFSVNPSWLREGKGEMFVEKRKETEEFDALTELFKAMEKLEGKVPRAVKRALIRAFETKDIEGLVGIMAGYLHDLKENFRDREPVSKTLESPVYQKKGNIAINSTVSKQVYKGEED